MQSKILNLSYNIVFELCKEALIKSNFESFYIDKNEGKIVCKTYEIVNFERVVNIRLKELEKSKVLVEVESKFTNEVLSHIYEKVDEKIFIKHLSMIFE